MLTEINLSKDNINYTAITAEIEMSIKPALVLLNAGSAYIKKINRKIKITALDKETQNRIISIFKKETTTCFGKLKLDNKMLFFHGFQQLSGGNRQGINILQCEIFIESEC